jgi:hypothetical protein
MLSADSFDSVLEFVLEWTDVFDIDVHPAVSAADSLESGPEGIRPTAARAAALCGLSPRVRTTVRAAGSEDSLRVHPTIRLS